MCPLNPAYHLSLKFGGVGVKSAFAGVAGKSRQKPVQKEKKARQKRLVLTRREEMKPEHVKWGFIKVFQSLCHLITF